MSYANMGGGGRDKWKNNDEGEKKDKEYILAAGNTRSLLCNKSTGFFSFSISRHFAQSLFYHYLIVSSFLLRWS